MSCGTPTISVVEAEFTRPANTTNYDTTDLVANSTTAGLVEPMEFEVNTGYGRGFEVVGVKVRKSGTGVTGATFSIYLYVSSPVSAAGDGATFSTDAANFLGKITLPAMTAFTDDAQAVIYDGAFTGGYNAIKGYLRSTNIIYGLLRAEDNYTDEASAEEFTVSLTLKQY